MRTLPTEAPVPFERAGEIRQIAAFVDRVLGPDGILGGIHGQKYNARSPAISSGGPMVVMLQLVMHMALLASALPLARLWPR